MAGYTPWMAGAVAAAKRGQEAARRRDRDAKYDQYAEYRAEQRACGYEVESFEEWLGEVDPKARAYERYSGRSLDDALYYGDTY